MPKKKAGKKGAKIIDGVATNEMTREQLMGHVKRMQMELNREREERNFFMLEREKLYALWNITLEQLAAAKGETRLADVRMDDNEREREAEMHIYKQKLRYLMTEQSRRVAEVKFHNLHQMKSLQQSTFSIQNSMRETIDKKNREISKNQSSIQNLMRQLQLENAENSSTLRSDFCTELRRIEATFERLVYEREKEQVLHENSEIQRTNLEKSEHIQQLVNLHQGQIKEMKEFFNEITANNFAVIAALQQEISQLKEKEEELKLKLGRCRKEIKNMEETQEKEREEMENKLKDDRKSAQEIKRQLKQSNNRVKQNDKYLRVLELKNETLIQKGEFVQRERNVLKETFTQTIIDMQKKAEMHRFVLEMKLNAASKNNRKKEVPSRFRKRSSSSDDSTTEASIKQSETHSPVMNQQQSDDEPESSLKSIMPIDSIGDGI